MYTQKTPIPISTQNGLYFFPTHAPKHIATSWINIKQVDWWDKVVKKDRNHIEQTEVIFKNGYQRTLDISMHTLNTQIERAFEVMLESGKVGK